MIDTVRLSEELLRTMRVAAQKAIELDEPCITLRAVLLALLEEPAIGTALGAAVNAEQLRNAQTVSQPAADALAFKTPDGGPGRALDGEAMAVFAQGARRAQERYTPRQLVLGVAAQATAVPGLLAALNVDPALFNQAAYRV